MSLPEDPHRDLAQWLQEVARRRHAEPVSRAPLGAHRWPADAAHSGRPRWQHLRHAVSFAALAAAYLQYHFLDVLLQIATMHPVVTFI